jgi:ribosomal protein S18 acetylase RimI-like enzyme
MEPVTGAGVTRIRRLAPSEATPLSALAQRLFWQAYGATHPAPALAAYLAAELGPETVSRELTCAGTVVFVAESAPGELLGYLWLAATPAPAEVAAVSERPLHLRRIFLDQGCHGSGLAAALLAAAVREAEDRGADALWLAVWQQAARPIAFYRRAGFRVVATARFALADHVDDDFLMVREIAPPALRGS